MHELFIYVLKALMGERKKPDIRHYQELTSRTDLATRTPVVPQTRAIVGMDPNAKPTLLQTPAMPTKTTITSSTITAPTAKKTTPLVPTFQR